MDLEWLKLRPYNGDQKSAFEELVCQLADAESIAYRKDFRRLGTPDGGVEAYCILPNGDEYGWQAKFFQSIGSTQWSEIKDSVETALRTHPNLIRYYICVPLDRPDARIKGQKSLMDKWDEKVNEWKKTARKDDREIEFVYWGSSELFSRLSKPEHVGRRLYWLNQTELDEEWFAQRLTEATQNLNKRYSPEINFELPISTVFHGLCRDKPFAERWKSQFDELKVISSKAIRNLSDKRAANELKKTSDALRGIYLLTDVNTPFRLSKIDQHQISQAIEGAKASIDILLSRLDDLDQLDKQAKPSPDSVSDQRIHGFSSDFRNFRETKRYLDDCYSYINSAEIQVANVPALALIGKAGMGKSHLLAAISNGRKERGLLSILVLGQHLTSLDDPWTQILRELHLKCDRDTFLGILNTIGETSGSRVLLCIDAINEGQGRRIWEDRISGFVGVVSQYPWIGLVISIRTSYQELLLPENVQQQHQISVVNHTGFEALEHEATKRFFSYYKIQLPSIPLLHPEFSNPLFLRLFCEGLYKKGLRYIPPGYEGISAIMNFFLDAVDATLARKYQYSESMRLTRYTVDSLAAKLLDAGSSSLPFDDTYSWILELSKLRVLTEPDRFRFIEDLIAEGVLNKDLVYQGNEYQDEASYREVIYFTYERFGDHLMAAHLINQYVDKNEPKTSFATNPRLLELFDKRRGLHHNVGLIEALSVQLPEKTGVEMHEALPDLSSQEPLVSGFIQSILWRKHSSYGEAAIKYINKINRNKYWGEHLLDTLLSVSASVGHPLNSDLLHRNLLRLSIADRDEWWTAYLHFKYAHHSDDPSSVQRVIDWAWSSSNEMPVDDDSALLLAQTLAWFHTSTNRTLRDSATKALVTILENRIIVLLKLLQAFEAVNDPYVYERLWTVAYGCTLRMQNTEGLSILAQYTYTTIFDKEEVYPHILLRDSARGVIERAVYLNEINNVDLTKIRPPYRSTFPTQYPTNEEIDQRYKIDWNSPDYKSHHRLQNWILHSMTTEYGRGTGGYGDFGRYTFQSALYNWKEANADGLSNLAVQWVFERYGWNVEKHGHIDWMIDNSKDRGDRHSVISERIGKKYQWLAMHEILALVADNITYEERWSNNNKPLAYEGPWEPYVRDIDPSILIKSTNRNKRAVQWWNPEHQMDWEKSPEEWLKDESDLPNPVDYIQLVDPKTKEEWLVLESHPSWHEPKQPGEDKDNVPNKELWHQLRAYLVKSDEYERFVDWSKTQNFMGRWMPESSNRYELYSREYYWSPGWQSLKSRWEQDEDTKLPWRDVHQRANRRGKADKFIGQAIVPTLGFLYEKSNDGSKEDTISFLKPSEFIFDTMKMTYTQQEGVLLNEKGEVVCLDPSVQHASISCLLVRKNDFLDMLKEQGLSVFWTVLGEKQVHTGIGGRPGYYPLEISGLVYFDNDKLVHHRNIHEELEETVDEEMKNWQSMLPPLTYNFFDDEEE